MGNTTFSWGRATGAGAAAIAVAFASVGFLSPGAPAGAAPPDDPPPSAHGITVVDWEELDPDVFNMDFDERVYDATVTTDAVYTPTSAGQTPELGIRIHLPDGYDHDRATGYDVLYLFHGGAADRTGWTNGHEGDLVQALDDSGYPGIVVMADGGYSGWYRDWASNTRGGFRPLWETFHMDQMVPWVDASFNTSDQRADRAIAGYSMGGYGALTYAARHSGEFGTVGSFSGGTDITADAPTGSGTDADQMIDNALAGFGATVPGTAGMDYLLPGTTTTERMEEVFGPQSGWDAVNPADLAVDGAYAPFDDAVHLYAGAGEAELYAWNGLFDQALDDHGVNAETCFGTGEHSWEEWRGHLTHFMTVLAGSTPNCPNEAGAPA